ncbi:hypothetical protein [Frigoribacterium sp. CFBP 13707]|uniref:hypothetical protein n=1 Tax=Frigoribacterium sp. CFBP 13707 TaxID=2775313 RepID=UPI001783285E|nr:hypothetical protein [Frigoribacterium sp. CFBP 13707]MBD8729388.1 hypothetical protein [Frigoribacterium sp. CFBP 13707]
MTLTVWVSSDRDFASHEFDQGRSLNISLGAPVVGQLDLVDACGADLAAVNVDGSGVFELRPCLLKGGAGYKMRVMTDGPPEPAVVQNPLIDADVIYFGSEIRATFSTQLRRHRRALLPALVGVAFMVVATWLETNNGTDSLELAWALIAPIVILFSSAFVLSVAAVLLPTRVDRAVKAVPGVFGDGQARLWRSRLRTGPPAMR